MTSHAAAIDRQTLANSLLDCGYWRCCDDDDALISHAEAQADHINRIRIKAGDESEAYLAGERRLYRHGLPMPDADTLRGQLARMCCSIWWRRQLRRLNARRMEQAQRVLGKVHDRAGEYVSQQGFVRRRAQHTRNARLLEATTATNQVGQEYTLAELAELGMANPDNRRAEMMMRVNETEREAQRLGHVGVFVTITCPSRYHAVRKGTATHNGKWLHGGAPDPRVAQRYLQKQWDKARAFLGRRGVGSYGLRVVEPHHDGCPHWHMVLWCEPQNVGVVLGVLRRYAVAEDWEEIAPKCDEEGKLAEPEYKALKRERMRFDAKLMKTEKGYSAAAYIIKYVSKNVNGQQQPGARDKETGKMMDAMAPRIEAWAATWGVRQFQFFGLPSVQVWRELRRLRDADYLRQWDQERDPSGSAMVLMQSLREAADESQWGEYMRLMKGPMRRRDERPAHAWTITKTSTRGAQTGRYGEPLKAPLGVVVLGYECVTRHYLWQTGEKGTKPSDAVKALRRQEAQQCREQVELMPFNGAAPRPLGAALDVATGQQIRLPKPVTLGGLGRLSFVGLGLTVSAFGAPRTRVNNSTRRFLGGELTERVNEDRVTRRLKKRGVVDRLAPGTLAEIHRQTDEAAAVYRIESKWRRIEREEDRKAREAHRQRIEEMKPIVAGWVLDGMEPTPEMIEVMTA